MADKYKVLGQAAGNGSLQDLYTPTSGKSAVVAFLAVCNKASTAKKFRVKLALGGAADSDSHNLYYDTLVLANDTLEICKGMTPNGADIVRVYGEDANVTFTLFGDEVS